MTDTTTPERGELERYRFMRDSMSDCFCDLDVVKNGDLVTFADYEALLAECARLREEIPALKVTLALTEKTVDEERAECARKDAEIARLRVQLGKGSTMNCAKCGGTGFVMSIHTGPSSGGMSYTKCDCGSYMVTINPGAPRDGE